MSDFVLLDDQNVNVAVAILDKAGNPTGDVFDAGTLTAVAADGNVSVTVSADQTSFNVAAVGPLVTAESIAINGSVNGTALPEATFVVNVDADAANPAGIGLTPGTPVANA